MGDRLTRLAARARGGDPRALEELIVASYDDVWRLCAVLVDEPSAEDLAQETFARVTVAVRRFRGDASARTWVLAIARRVCVDEIRSRTRRRRRDALLSAGESGAAPPLGGDLATIDLLARLEPDRRAAFVLTQLFRLTYEEAALVCGCPTGTIRSRVARARDELIRLTMAPSGAHRVPRS